MKEKFVDLHIHTTSSDGLLSPEEVVEIAKGAGLSAMAIADHDAIDGIFKAKVKAEELKIELIPAVELSVAYKGDDFHMLAYLVDYEDENFRKRIESFRDERLQRGEKMVKKLNEMGINLSLDAVRAIAQNSSVGRPHLADALIKGEYVHTYEEAFARYLGYHAPAYVPKKYLTPEEGIELIHEVKGISVLAHPGTTRRDEVIPDLIGFGLDGLEAYHSQYDLETTQYYINLANKFGLIYTGGSDCHGRRDKLLIGTVKVPYQCLQRLKDLKRQKYG
jgi:predicted metal-dependent phosphoesterase TrpH